jgi:hypothetical protein
MDKRALARRTKLKKNAPNWSSCARFGDVLALLCVDDAQVGTPNEADGAEEHEAELGRHDCEIDNLCGGKDQPCGMIVDLEEHREPESTHQPRISVGAYFVLRLSATPEVPLPSMRDIDVKNQPTTNGAMSV